MYPRRKQLAVAAILVLATFCSLVGAKRPNKKLVCMPECQGKSVDKGYNNNVRHLIDFFVDETKNMYRKTKAEDYVMSHSYPNMDCAGSVTGTATCNNTLGTMDCWSCLVKVKDTINSRCHHPFGATVKLRDCSMTFKELR